MTSTIVKGAPVRLTLNSTANDLVTFPHGLATSLAASARVAGAEDLQVVADLPKAVLLRNGIRPPLYGRSRDFDRTTTDATDQMMMVSGRAPAVRRLTLVGSDGVEVPNIVHELQSPIDGGQADAFAVMTQVVVNLLRRPKVVLIRQDLLDRGALPGTALGT
jgi:hypothetical protein